MIEDVIIKPVEVTDSASLKAIIDAVGLFPSDLLDGMLAGYLAGNGSGEFWLHARYAGASVAVAYCAPETMTEGTWNLLLIAVLPAQQGKGIGTALLADVESNLRQRSQRVLLVETSGLPEFRRACGFYAGNGFSQEARIRDYYRHGEDKIVFWKKLQ